jgi:alpha-amylase
MGLRELIPWRPVPELIDYLRAAAADDGSRVGVMGDDGEKLGGWPGTHELCWGREAWVEKCFTALEKNEDWLTTLTPADWLVGHPPSTRIYIPTSSYVEMTQWALPADESAVFGRLRAEAESKGSPAARFLRGGLWRNFQARYREINDLHKQMLRVSAAVDQLPEGADRERALDHLYRGQSNDCYWHGLFGGIYIVHMRMATLAELIAAEDIVQGNAPQAGVADYDLDGRDEILIGTPGQSVLIDPAEGAGIGSWDLRAARVALASVLRRRPEAYHQKLKRATDATNRALATHIEYDDHERRSALLRVRDTEGREIGGFVSGEWRVESATESEAVLSRLAPGSYVRKRVLVDGSRRNGSLSVEVEIQNRGVGAFRGWIELEWNINLMGGGGNEHAYYQAGKVEHRHDGSGSVGPGEPLSFGNEHEGVDIVTQLEPAGAQEWSSVDTVSNSEAGFELIHQGSCLIQRWPLEIGPAETRSFSTTFSVTQSRDRAAED